MKPLGLLLLGLMLCGSAHTVSVVTKQVTIGASVTQVSTTDIYSSQITFQDNATHVMRVGDASTSSTRGALLSAGAPGGSATFNGGSSGKGLDLADFYVAGTAADVLDVIYIQ